MSSERELDEGIKSIKSAWQREHTARTNLKRMLEQAEAENAKLKELVRDLYRCDDESCTHCNHWNQGDGFYCDLGVGWKARRMRELGIEVER